MVIPHWFVLVFYGIASAFALVITWFALLFTGRYPQGLYDFNSGFVRYSSRVTAYWLLLSDEFPPFSGSVVQPYPVDLQIGPPKDKYSRLHVFLRYFPLIVVSIIQYALMAVLFFAVLAAWFVILVVGKLPQGLHSAIAFCTSYFGRSFAYAYLLSETFPGFDGAPGPVPAPVGGVGEPDAFRKTV